MNSLLGYQGSTITLPLRDYTITQETMVSAGEGKDLLSISIWQLQEF